MIFKQLKRLRVLLRAPGYVASGALLMVVVVVVVQGHQCQFVHTVRPPPLPSHKLTLSYSHTLPGLCPPGWILASVTLGA